MKLIDAKRVPADEAADLAKAFVNDHRIRRLNVAGPRDSKWLGAHAYAFQVVAGLLVDTPQAIKFPSIRSGGAEGVITAA